MGAEHVVLSNDLGQIDRPPPGDGLARFRELLLAEGLTPREIDVALRDNPAALLGWRRSDSRLDLAPRAPEPRVPGVPDVIGQEVETEHGDDDGQPWE